MKVIGVGPEISQMMKDIEWVDREYIKESLNQMEDISLIKSSGNVSYLPSGKKVSERGVWVNVRTEQKVGRNEPCSCGSGLKSKKCCFKS